MPVSSKVLTSVSAMWSRVSHLGACPPLCRLAPAFGPGCNFTLSDRAGSDTSFHIGFGFHCVLLCRQQHAETPSRYSALREPQWGGGCAALDLAVSRRQRHERNDKLSTFYLAIVDAAFRERRSVATESQAFRTPPNSHLRHTFGPQRPRCCRRCLGAAQAPAHTTPTSRPKHHRTRRYPGHVTHPIASTAHRCTVERR